MQPIHILSSAVLLAGLASLDATQGKGPGPETCLLAGPGSALPFISPEEGARAQDAQESYWARIWLDTPFDPETAPPTASFHYGDGDNASSYFTGGHETSGKYKSNYYSYEGFPTTRWFHVTEGAGKSWFQRDIWFSKLNATGEDRDRD
jgi:hypothetical protein